MKKNHAKISFPPKKELYIFYYIIKLENGTTEKIIVTRKTLTHPVKSSNFYHLKAVVRIAKSKYNIIEMGYEKN